MSGIVGLAFSTEIEVAPQVRAHVDADVSCKLLQRGQCEMFTVAGMVSGCTGIVSLDIAGGCWLHWVCGRESERAWSEIEDWGVGCR